MPGSPSPSPFQTLAPSSPGIALLPAAAGMPSAVAGYGHDDFSIATDCDGPPFPYSLPHAVPLAALSSSSSEPSSAPLPVVRPLAPSSLCSAIHAHQQLSARPVAASHGGVEKWRQEEMRTPEVGVTWWRGPLSRPEQAFPRISAATSHSSAAQLQFRLPPSFSLPPPILALLGSFNK